MKINSEQWGSVVLLLMLFSVAFIVSQSKELSSTCGNDLNCRVLLANATHNPTLCSGFNHSDACYYNVALYSSDISICPLTSNSSRCISLIAKETRDPTLCFKTNSASDCVFQIAYDLKTSSICDFLGANASRCLFSYALAYSDRTLCSRTGKFESTCLKRVP
jgi:hypothetical protein